MPRDRKARSEDAEQAHPEAPISTDQFGIDPTSPDRASIMGFEDMRKLMRHQGAQRARQQAARDVAHAG